MVEFGGWAEVGPQWGLGFRLTAWGLGLRARFGPQHAWRPQQRSKVERCIFESLLPSFPLSSHLGGSNAKLSPGHII